MNTWNRRTVLSGLGLAGLGAATAGAWIAPTTNAWSLQEDKIKSISY